MSNCLFCRIIAGDAPSSIVHSGDRIVAFHDTNPQAPLHVLIVPRRHIPTLNDLTSGDDQLVGEMMRLAATIANERGFATSGYRTVFNCNAGAGQSIFHIHLHVLAGRRFRWPPG
jgi:histidine triad (HIT) family protein